MAALLIIGSLIWLGERYIRWVSTHFILTSDRIIWREGVVAKKGIEFPLQRINTIFFSQRIFERLLGLGDLKIESASESGTQIFEDIRSPGKVQHEIYAQMEANENRGLDKLGDRLTAQAQAPAAQAPAAPPADGGRPDRRAAPAARVGRPHRGRVRGQEGRAARPHLGSDRRTRSSAGPACAS